MKRLVALLLLAAMLASLLASCAAPRTRRPTLDSGDVEEEVRIQQRMVVEEQMRMIDRIQTVGYPILKANEPLCERKMRYFGMQVETLSGVNRDWREAYRQVLGLDERPTVISVVPGGPADKAGIKTGDRIFSVNNAATGTGVKSFHDILADDFDTNNPLAPVHFQMQRNALPVTANVIPEQTCGYPLLFDSDDAFNAYANGKSIIVHAGLLRGVETDEELAMVIAHELAHNTQGHIQAKGANMAVGTFFGLLLYGLTGVNVTGSLQQIGAQAYSQSFEFEADYVGLYYSARAGYGIKDPPYLWRKMSLRAPGQINYGSSHPSNAERFQALRATVQEIEAKRAAGQELAPEYERVAAAQEGGSEAGQSAPGGSQD